MRVSELMVVDPVTVPDGAVLAEAVRLMDEHGIRHLPVLRGDALVGVLSDRDLLEPAAKLVSSVGDEGELEPPLVRHVMRPQPVTVSPEATVAEAAGVLAEHGIGCLPVTRGGALVGFLTENDLLEALVASSRYGVLGSEKDPPVRACMTADPTTADGRTTLDEASARMSAGDFRHLPVTGAAGRLAGIVSDRDLRRAAGRGLDPTTPVLELATRAPTTATASESVSRAARRLSHERIGALPVVDGDGRVVGILTVTDVLAHAARVLD